jgi:tRNA A58 N-methylase Trm61
MSAKILTNATDLAKEIVIKAVQSGDVVVDCTLGKGNDALFLGNLVGAEGRVYGFDVQRKAIEISTMLLSQNDVIDRAYLIEDSHENIDKYVKEEASAIMYNLGYLPTGDRSIVTKPQSTVTSIEKSLEIVKKNGVVTIAIYTGHPGGLEEERAILDFLVKLDNKSFNVLQMDFINLDNNPPKLIAIEKK